MIIIIKSHPRETKWSKNICLRIWYTGTTLKEILTLSWWPYKDKSEDTTGVIRSHNWEKNRQYNKRKEKVKKKNNGWQNTTPKTKDWETGTTLKMGVNSGAL